MPLGTVTRIGPDWFELDASEPLANGDGLTYLHKREVVGLQANRAERIGDADAGPGRALARLAERAASPRCRA